ncbi:MAG: hypothetical protein ACMXYG_04575 [Candidatus Woesearchaeota archaeon]
MIYFNWPLIILTTVVLYILIIISLPFSALFATIALFSLIGYWSQLPGFCIMEPVRFLYMMDFIDIFTIVIALHVGVPQAIAFTLFWNIYPRLSGAFLPWMAVFKDGLTQSTLCLFVPFFSYLAGGDIVLVVLIYSVLRMPIFFLWSLILPHMSIEKQIFHCTVAGISMFVIDLFYVVMFGSFFESLVQSGASFSWLLFFIATVIIFAFLVFIYGFSPMKAIKSVGATTTLLTKRIINSKKKKIEHNDDFVKDIINRI